MTRKSYSELILLDTFEERLSYLQCFSGIGIQTFGESRHLNQYLYKDPYWVNEVRPRIIMRDGGCDLGIASLPLNRRSFATIHHINPITVEQVLNHDPIVFDPNNLILCSANTHRLIHYCKTKHEDRVPVTRSKYDTCPWKITI